MFVIILIILALITYIKLIQPLSYWKSRGVKYKKPIPILGNSSPLLFNRKSFFEHTHDLYKEFSNERYFGSFLFGKPVLYINDLELIKRILIKDFDQFVDHNNIISEEAEPLVGRNLFNLKEQEWRHMRPALSPLFTSSKMRIMFTLVSDIAQEFVKYFEKQNKQLIDLEMKDTFTRFTNDAVASTCFSLKIDSLKNETNQLYVLGKEATSFSGIRYTAFNIYTMIPKIAKMLKLRIISRTAASFFRRVIKETLQKRETEDLIQFDLIHLLMEARKSKISGNDCNLENKNSEVENEKKDRKMTITDEDITALSMLFYFGGFEPSSNFLTFMSYELAKNPTIQRKLQTEIAETLKKCDGQVTYEAINEMKYFSMVVAETLRKWPPAFILDRVCTKDYIIEPSNPWEKRLIIERGTILHCSVVGIHWDPRYFPNPKKFNPERFSDQSKIPLSSYLPFGLGPRSCIGSRFSLMENKILFFHLLSKFDIVTTNKTSDSIKLKKDTPNLVSANGIWLGLSKRSF
ncbi:hypothetical protein RN001_013365 [Aquatica leii]|uniref:Cytochrome P450 n=1 Tax=Aquatica leii TaxID=1421715 RepID=A0AAN7SNP9_9COLE|nr:hypothetical protein RN001_013365 [Aquatica leii]